ncbi:hypothetical protein DRO37_09680 [Candidatus Bathyarchaeota archaeon]|nr:MAG: hypothetical protein DRO37_09680 [Candidatus Bathyarchaeota archaeon]
MKAKLICYTLGNIDHQTRSKFKRNFFGYVDKSNNNQYKYQRKGLLTEIPHNKPIRSTVIVKAKDEAKIIKFLKKFNAETKTYWIIIDKNELKIPTGTTH